MNKKILSIMVTGAVLVPAFIPNQMASTNAAGIPSTVQVDQKGVTDPVSIPDANLAKAIRQQLALPAGAVITEGDMANLTHLNASGYGITDLTGIEYAINLTDINVSDNQITSLAPLSTLTNLTGIAAERNLISDVSPIADLTNLSSLYLSSNQITDISDLADLVKLTTLNLNHNQIVDVTPLANMPKLIFVNLEHNQISDVTPLANLTNIVRLDLDYNQISDLSPLNPILSANLSVIISADDQVVRQSEQVITNGGMTTTFGITDIRGNVVVPIIISDNGIYDLGTDTIAWGGLPVGEHEATATWVYSFRDVVYSGTFVQPYSNTVE